MTCGGLIESASVRFHVTTEVLWAFEWFVNYCEHCVCGVWRAPSVHHRWVTARRYIEHEQLLSSYRTGRRSAWLLGADHRVTPC